MAKTAPPSGRMLDAALYQTSRLALRPPRHDDAAAVFRRIASDPRVTVLERCHFVSEGILRRHTVFPNLGVPEPQDVYCYARIPERLHAA